jgi:RNA polymerase sigma-70 factor (ECF subfamily)
METSQETWISRLSRDGDVQTEALDELRDILWKRISFSFRNHSVVDGALVDDIVQDALMKILKSLGQFEGRAQFITWATTIAVRTAYTELRRKHWKDVSLDSLFATQGESIPTSDATANESPERRRMIDAMHVAIKERLSEKQRVALLAELAGLPLEEIGRRTGSNRNAIYKLTHDARKRLRKQLESDGFTAADFLSPPEAI